MKLQNKKTGEIGLLHCDMQIKPMKIGVVEDTDIRGHYWEYSSLAELNEEWEDYEEPKTYWSIKCSGEVYEDESDASTEHGKKHREIGNYFETKEEAKLAVKKLKAWKRLNDKLVDHILKYEFDEITEDIHGTISFTVESYPGVGKDLDLLFGCEDE